MAKFEDDHLRRLAQKIEDAGDQVPQSFAEKVIEGGFGLESLRQAFIGHADSPQEIVQLAMMFEAQAQDLYTRLTRQANKPELQAFYQMMVAEEQQHLDQLSGFLDVFLVMSNGEDGATTR
jgi:hypothetical protein